MAGYPVVADLRQVAEQRGCRISARASAGKADGAAAGDGANDVHGQDGRFYVAVEAPIGFRLRRVAPAQHEHLQAGPDEVANEAFIRLQVEHIELVDLGRDEEHRPLAHSGGLRRVLNQLEPIVTIDDGARSEGEVLAYFI